LTAKQ